MGNFSGKDGESSRNFSQTGDTIFSMSACYSRRTIVEYPPCWLCDDVGLSM